jgi:hypothetical protein
VVPLPRDEIADHRPELMMASVEQGAFHHPASTLAQLFLTAGLEL